MVLARRLIAVMSSRDCVSCSDLATNGSAAIVLVGKKSITAVRGSSRDQSASSGARRPRPGAALLADMNFIFSSTCVRLQRPAFTHGLDLLLAFVTH